MRSLYLSERRFIRNLLLRHRGAEPSEYGQVMTEGYYPRRNLHRSRFNNDFELRFVSKLTEYECCHTTVLPNTYGADLFLTFDSRTLQPLMTELMDGEAFPIRYYKRFVAEIEAQLKSLGQRVAIRRCAYSRIFVIEGDICFLAFPRESVPVIRGVQQMLHSDANMSIACAVEAGSLVYVDGWIRTDVAASDWKLIAVEKR